MREYYTEAYYARILNSNVNYKTNKNQSYGNSQRIHPPHEDCGRKGQVFFSEKGLSKGEI